MKPIEFPEKNVAIAKDQPEYIPLPAHIAAGRATFCWQLSWHERFQLLVRGKIWHQVLTFGKPLQPQLLLTQKPSLLKVTRL